MVTENGETPETGDGGALSGEGTAPLRVDGEPDRRFRLDPRDLAAFIIALREGATVEEAAKAAGLALSSLYWRRERDAAFAAAWDAAIEESARPVLIAAQNKRELQLQWTRRVKFTPARRETFLAHFAATGDETAAAAKAGVSTDTVYRLRRRDPDFAAAWQAALEAAVTKLDAELVRQRLAAVERMRAAVEAGAVAALDPEQAAEFERALKLVQRYDRRARGGAAPGARTVHRDRLRTWDFGEAMTRLEKKLVSMGVVIDEAGLAPRPDDERDAA
ncbi:MAG TPA: hypothetical protein VD887_04935 [Allosphingosinicella sp.]|nr:hypothetical protein [Allosphingosinicella sp.]